MRESNFNLLKEITKRQEMYDRLDQLSGYNKLSENQQRFIRTSLYSQQRAERGTNEQSAANIQTIPSIWTKNAPGGTLIKHGPVITDGQIQPKEPNNYSESQLKIMLDYCHSAAARLEECGGEDIADKEWFEADPIKSYDDLIGAIELVNENFDFPYYVEIYHLNEDNPRLSHSTILLGEDSEKNIIAWEKSGYGLPYQLISLSDLYKAYTYCHSWKFRPLSIGDQAT